MGLYESLACFVVFVTGLFHLLLNFNRWWYIPRLNPKQAPLPPGNLGWPVFGNMPAFLQAFKSGNPDGFIRGYNMKFGSIGMFKAYLFWQPSIIATAPETCKFVLMNDSMFETGWPLSAKRLTGMKSFAGLTGKEHLRLRKLTEPSLNSPNALQQIVLRMSVNIQKALKKWSQEESILLITEMRKFACGTICDVLYGEKSAVNVDELAPHFARLNEGIRALPINIPGTAFYKALKARKTIDKYSQKIIDKRRMSGDAKESDVLSLLLNDEIGEPGNDSQVIDMLVMFMNGGHESTALLMSWIIIFLNRHPSVYNKLKDEQDNIAKGKLPGELLTYWDIRKMKFLPRVIDETLRMVNISSIVFRKAIQDTEYKGLTIPKGWHALPWLRQLHMDSGLHPDPDNFDPERWLKQPPEPFTFMPFGMGSRLCPGNELAKMEANVVIHYMITCYEFKPLNPACRLKFLPHPMPLDLYPVKVVAIR